MELRGLITDVHHLILEGSDLFRRTPEIIMVLQTVAVNKSWLVYFHKHIFFEKFP